MLTICVFCNHCLILVRFELSNSENAVLGFSVDVGTKHLVLNHLNHVFFISVSYS